MPNPARLRQLDSLRLTEGADPDQPIARLRSFEKLVAAALHSPLSAYKTFRYVKRESDIADKCLDTGRMPGRLDLNLTAAYGFLFTAKRILQPLAFNHHWW